MLGWDGNPLRRRIDRVEAAMVAGLIAVFLISAPMLAAATGHWIASAGMREQRTEVAWRLCLAGVAGQILLARRRLADWNRAWHVAEPRWTKRC
jgi:hypothetical protein